MTSELYSPASSQRLGDEIERLCEEITVLTREQAEIGATSGEDEIERAFARLLELQTAEADMFSHQFEANLNMPIDAGEQILARARALRESNKSTRLDLWSPEGGMSQPRV